MPVISIYEEEKKAQKGHYCIPLFDVFDTNSTEGVLNAAVAKNAPVIVGIYNGLFDKPTAGPFMAYLPRNCCTDAGARLVDARPWQQL